MYELEYVNIEENKDYENVVSKIIPRCFEEEKIDSEKLCVEIMLTTPEEIRKINKKYRNIDKATDVLSFPMFEKNELRGKKFEKNDVLGNIVISIEQVKIQAVEYGHSFERELSYMLVHGFCHLIGFDHIEEEDKKEMRCEEEKILREIKRS